MSWPGFAVPKPLILCLSLISQPGGGEQKEGPGQTTPKLQVPILLTAHCPNLFSWFWRLEVLDEGAQRFGVW